MKTVITAVIILCIALALFFRYFDPAMIAKSKQLSNTDLIDEQLAYHYGVMAYLYGYPIVDMAKQMHNETHRHSPDQQVYAPVNKIYRFPTLITPETAGNLRAPNSDTLYFSAWVDLTDGPIILHTPDTNHRYYTIAVTDQYSEVEHIGRSTTGTKEGYFALTSPTWNGAIPQNTKQIKVATPKAWLLGRMLVDSPADFAEAKALVDDIWLSSLSNFMTGKQPTPSPEQQAPSMAPLGSLQFFEVLNQQLKTLPSKPDEQALIAQFNQIGIGPDREFNSVNLSKPVRKGLEKAINDAEKIVEASTFRKIKDYNGWMVSTDMGRYGYLYMHRASVVRGGYSNLPEESLYAAALFDDNENMLNGKSRYEIRFAANNLPPVNGFWSIAAYTLDAKLVENNIRRYSFGDRTEGIKYGADGSLTVVLQHTEPQDNKANWLPTPDQNFVIVLRLYEPDEKALTMQYVYPAVQKIQ